MSGLEYFLTTVIAIFCVLGVGCLGLLIVCMAMINNVVVTLRAQHKPYPEDRLREALLLAKRVMFIENGMKMPGEQEWDTFYRRVLKRMALVKQHELDKTLGV